MSTGSGADAGTPASVAPSYAVPALEKAFDVLDVVAASAHPLSQTEIAEAVGRSVGQLFRILVALESRGWLIRDAGGLYTLSMAPFDLAHRQPALRGLLVAATPVLRTLAERIRQSCNLAVLDRGAVRVVAQVESPADFGFQVRVGALFPLTSTAGTALVAAAEPEIRREHGDALDPREIAELEERGRLVRSDPQQPAVTDVSVPILDRQGHARAVLTVPWATSGLAAPADVDVVDHAVEAARTIAARLNGDDLTSAASPATRTRR